MRRYALTILALTVLLAGCTTATETMPPRTATEQLLISAAAERAADKLALTLPKDSRIFVYTTNFDGYDVKNAIVAVHTALLKQGVRIVGDKKDAQVIVEIRAGALSIDKNQTMVGIPSFNVPVPLASAPLTTPELAFYKDDDQRGVAKFALVAYDAKDGSLKQAGDPQFGFSHKFDKTLLFLFSWQENDILPDENGNAVTRQVDKILPKDE